VRILSELAGDLAAAANWYDQEGGRELGDRFVALFYSKLLTAAGKPEAHGKAYGEFRRILLKPFPYKLYFRVVGREVVFVLLIHAARDPRTTEKLLRDRKF
jgi:hypothetical protein